MNTPVQPIHRWFGAALLGVVTVAAAACSTQSSAPGPTQTVVVTPSQSAASTPASSPTSSAPTQSSAPAGPAECATSALHVYVGQGQGAAGTLYFNLDFTNVSGSACVLQGYPGVSLVSVGSDAGSQIGSDAKRNPLRPPHLVTLAPGQTANALLGIAQAGNFPASTCQPVTAHWLKVFPPDQFVATYVNFTTQTCASTSVPTMHVTRIAAGA